MKIYFILFLQCMSFVGWTQNTEVIQLPADSAQTARMGCWRKGEYQVLVDLMLLETHFRAAAADYGAAVNYYQGLDSASIAFYRETALRYDKAADELTRASDGYDLSQMNIYHGLDRNRDAAQTSMIIENLMYQFVVAGNAAVYYKTDRLTELHLQHNFIGTEPLNYGNDTLVYARDVSDYLFRKTQIYGW
jgi:hypothetical protein